MRAFIPAQYFPTVREGRSSGPGGSGIAGIRGSETRSTDSSIAGTRGSSIEETKASRSPPTTAKLVEATTEGKVTDLSGVRESKDSHRSLRATIRDVLKGIKEGTSRRRGRAPIPDFAARAAVP